MKPCSERNSSQFVVSPTTNSALSEGTSSVKLLHARAFNDATAMQSVRCRQLNDLLIFISVIFTHGYNYLKSINDTLSL